jgi:hypothetical protein
MTIAASKRSAQTVPAMEEEIGLANEVAREAA